jgi:hypothetical protein
MDFIPTCPSPLSVELTPTRFSRAVASSRHDEADHGRHSPSPKPVSRGTALLLSPQPRRFLAFSVGASISAFVRALGHEGGSEGSESRRPETDEDGIERWQSYFGNWYFVDGDHATRAVGTVQVASVTCGSTRTVASCRSLTVVVPVALTVDFLRTAPATRTGPSIPLHGMRIRQATVFLLSTSPTAM